METTERWFKLVLDLLLSMIAAGLLSVWLPLGWAALGGFVIAHTLNFLFNGQVYAVLKHFGGVRHTWPEYNREIELLRARIAQEPCIVYAAAYGSLAREEWKPTSDLDILLVRAPGLACGFRACLFAARERTRAFWNKFPLDMFVLDDFEALNKAAEKRSLIVLGKINEEPEVKRSGTEPS
jgi:predicted nucleotidyltransferase